MNRNKIRACWDASRPALGSFVFSHDPANTEIVAASGFDFVIVDTEHTTVTPAEVEHHARAGAVHDCPTLVRVPPEEIASCGRLLDAGVKGIVMSHFGVDEQASATLSAIVRYAPVGHRPSCSGVRSTAYSLRPFADCVRDDNPDMLAIGVVEDLEVVEKLDRLLSTVPVDAIMPGPGDLSTALGLPGQPTHPRVREVIRDIVRGARRAGARVGMYLNTPAEAEEWQGEGFDFFIYLFDYKVLAHAYRTANTAIRERMTSTMVAREC
jgi:2-keto-3-deoxy-L-rhamnonate aldolase RhmA